jgi:hypothetical protein
MNKYLEKIASLKSIGEAVSKGAKDFKKGFARSSTTSKIGLGMSATGLGLGTANFKNSIENKHDNKHRGEIEQKSLETLRDIHTELQKKAAEDKKKDSGFHPGLALGASILGGIASAPLALAGQHFGKKTLGMVDSAEHSGSDLHTVRKFMRDNKMRGKTTFNHRMHNINKHGIRGDVADHLSAAMKHGGSGPAVYAADHFGGHGVFVGGVRQTKDGTNKTRAIKNSDVIMHELGHAKDFSTHTKIKSIGTRIGRHPGSSGVFSLASTAALSNEKTRDYAPAIAAIPSLAIMREEGAANYHAYQGIKAHKGAAGANKFLRHALKNNTLNYGLTVAAPVAAAYVGKKIMEKLHPAKKKEGSE